MADDAAAVLGTLEIPSATSPPSRWEARLRRSWPFAIRSWSVRSLVLNSTYTRPDGLFRSQLDFWRWLPEVAPSERAVVPFVA